MSSAKQSVRPIAIIGAMQQEIAYIHEALTLSEVVNVADMSLHLGDIHSVPVAVVLCGIGKVNAAIAATLLIERYAPVIMVNSGCAAGIDSRLALGDVVIGEQLMHHDVDLTAFGYALGQVAKMPGAFSSDARLIELAHQAAQATGVDGVHYGDIVSGDAFIADPVKVSIIKQHFPNAYAIDMEAAAIAQTCHFYGIPFVSIKAISDVADGAAISSFEEMLDTAGKNSAKTSLNMLTELAESMVSS